VLVGTQQETKDIKLGGPRVGWVMTGLLATIVVGVSGSLAALGDTLFPAASLSESLAQDLSATSPILLRLRGVHPISAVIAAAFVFWVVVQAKRHGYAGLGKIVFLLLGIQFGLGLLDVLLLAPTWMQIVHLLGADLYWIALVMLSSYLLWPPDKDRVASVA